MHGLEYPDRYNRYIPERHSEAIASCPRQMVHDLYSLQVIIQDYLARFEGTELRDLFERIGMERKIKGDDVPVPVF